jgi:hypothetical protein
MKRVKFMLTSIAIMAVVGGALAFNAKRTNVFCGTKDAAAGSTACPLKVLTTFTTTTTGSLYCTDNSSGTCIIRAKTSPGD